MKVRWRVDEASLVIILALITIIGYVSAMFRLTPAQEEIIKTTFADHHVPYNYLGRILLPQIGCILILLLSYFWVNRLIIPQLKTIGFNLRSVGILLLSALQLIVVIYLIGPVINFISFYASPFMLPSLNPLPFTFGSHPQPFLNTFGGFEEAMTLMLMYALYALLRELTVHYLERQNNRRLYRIAISNQVTVFAVVFFALPFMADTLNMVVYRFYYNAYFAFVPPVLLMFITNIYRLFPLNDNKPWMSFKFIGPVLLYSFIWSFGFSIFLGEHWFFPAVLISWAVQALIITPISWIDYRNRKDKILELRGVEEALVKSTADLQFLRSQINPHFLFNALNTLYGTALLEGSKNTAEGIQKLGDMMRFMLHDNTLNFIPMEKEIEYLKNYIALQKLRTQLSGDIEIDEEISEQNGEQAIAPMLLIPFVENAFKHGISLTAKSWIKIKLVFEAENIVFEVRNSLHQAQVNDPEKDHSGIGLKNVKERLLLLYPGKHQFNYGKEGNEFVAKLTVNKMGTIKYMVKLF